MTRAVSQSVCFCLGCFDCIQAIQLQLKRTKKGKQQQRQQTPDDNFDALARFDLTYLLLLTKRKKEGICNYHAEIQTKLALLGSTRKSVRIKTDDHFSHYISSIRIKTSHHHNHLCLKKHTFFGQLSVSISITGQCSAGDYVLSARIKNGHL